MAVVSGLALGLALGPASGRAAEPYAAAGWERYFHVDWTVGPPQPERSITGYLYNDYDSPAWKVALAIDALDAAGEVTRTTVRYVAGDIPGRSRTYFRLAVAEAAAYRVRVLAFDFTNCRD